MYPIIILFLLIFGTIQEWALTAQVYAWLEQQNGSTAAFFQVALSFGLSAMLGISLFRRVGLQLLRKAQVQLAQGIVPDRTLAEGLVLVLAAFLLIAPGYLSDLIAVILLILRRPLATLILKFVKKKFVQRPVHVTRVNENPLIIDVPAHDVREKS